MTSKLAPLFAALFVLAACGSADPDGAAAGPNPDTAVTGAPASHDAGPSRPELREPQDDVIDARPRSFDSHKAKGRKLSLFYYSGVAECNGVDRIEVDEGPDEVIVTIFEGRRPEAEICPEIAVEVRSVVTLDRALGNRKVVDGAD